MELAQKTSLGIILFLLVVNVLLLFSNSEITGFILQNEGEIRAPHNFIDEEDIIAYDDKVVLEIENYTLSKYSDSGSMIPIFNSSSNGVGVKPKSVDDLHVGDIITFRQNDILIAHRIVEKGVDKNGWFFITKGDRNNVSDGKIRFEEIESMLIAVIY